jgi:hypothetical protein
VEADRGAVTWPIDRGLLVASRGRGRGDLRLAVQRPLVDQPGDDVTVTVSSEVVNFYPTIAGQGWFARIGQFIYNQTQLRIHVIVSNAFLRSLANLDLADSHVGTLTPGAPQRSPAASPDRGER